MKKYLLSGIFLLISSAGVAQNVLIRPDYSRDIIILENDTLEGQLKDNMGDRLLIEVDKKNYYVQRSDVKQLYLRTNAAFIKKSTTAGRDLMKGGSQLGGSAILGLIGMGAGTALVFLVDPTVGGVVAGASGLISISLFIAGTSNITRAGRKLDAVDYVP